MRQSALFDLELVAGHMINNTKLYQKFIQTPAEISQKKMISKIHWIFKIIMNTSMYLCFTLPDFHVIHFLSELFSSLCITLQVIYNQNSDVNDDLSNEMTARCIC